MGREARYALSLSRARYLWEMTFFSSLVISAYLWEVISLHRKQNTSTHVLSKPLGWNTGSQPNVVGPRAGTIVPSVLPSNRIGSEPGPALYANVHSAKASFVGKPTRRLFNPYQSHHNLSTDDCSCRNRDTRNEPSCPRVFMKCLMYGPGRPPSAS